MKGTVSASVKKQDLNLLVNNDNSVEQQAAAKEVQDSVYVTPRQKITVITLDGIAV